MKVYVATHGQYSDYRICHVFRNREDAEAYADSDNVEEYELLEGPVERRAWHRLYWHAGQPDQDPGGVRAGNPWMFSDHHDFDGDPRRVEHKWTSRRAVNADDVVFDMPVLTVEGWDRDRVLKVYSEQRAQHLARQQGVS